MVGIRYKKTRPTQILVKNTDFCNMQRITQNHNYRRKYFGPQQVLIMDDIPLQKNNLDDSISQYLYLMKKKHFFFEKNNICLIP